MEDIVSFLERAVPMLLTKNNKGYGLQPIPSEVDHEITDLINVFIQANPANREMILSKFDEEHAFTFIAYSERMAALAVRQQSSQIILKGLIALIIDGFKYNPLESLTILSLHYHSAEKIGVNPASLFDEAAKYADDKVATMISRFITRSPEDKSLEAMGYEEMQASNGFKYQRNW